MCCILLAVVLGGAEVGAASYPTVLPGDDRRVVADHRIPANLAYLAWAV